MLSKGDVTRISSIDHGQGCTPTFQRSGVAVAVKDQLNIGISHAIAKLDEVRTLAEVTDVERASIR